MSERILVTVGAGFIVSHLAEALAALGHVVRISDNLATGRRVNLDKVISAVEMVEGDICNLTAVRSAMAGIGVMYHPPTLPAAFSRVLGLSTLCLR